MSHAGPFALITHTLADSDIPEDIGGIDVKWRHEDQDGTVRSTGIDKTEQDGFTDIPRKVQTKYQNHV